MLPSGSGSAMSLTHPRDVAKALFKAAGSGVSGGVYQVKSFDASVEAVAAAVMEREGKRAAVKREGLFSKTGLPEYAASQVRAGVVLERQDSWESIGYSPEYDVERTCREIAEWHGKEPWLTESERA